MRDDVCIVLNEREPLKRQMAVELEEQLVGRQFAAKRIDTGEHLARVVLERNPRVLVLDYLLGDVTTALDVLSELKSQSSAEHGTGVVLWTDEPSIQVAISAMKLGAVDYIEMGLPSSLEKVLQAIDSVLRQGKKQQTRHLNASTQVLPDKLIAQSKNYQQCMTSAQGAANRSAPAICLLGQHGSGRNTLAKFIHQTRIMPGVLIEIDLDTWPYSIDEICGSAADPRITPLLSNGATVMIDHVECDPGELLNKLHERKAHVWSPRFRESSPMLIIGTSNQEVAHAWHRLLDAEIITLPSLQERNDDLWPLVQRFLHEAQSIGTMNKLKFSAQSIQELAKLAWPGNLRELRSVIIEAVTTPLVQIQEELKQQEETKSGSAREQREGTQDEQISIRAVIAAKLRWARYNLQEYHQPTTLTARQAVDQALGNLRIAAALLGTSVPQLKDALRVNLVNGHSHTEASGISFDGQQ